MEPKWEGEGERRTGGEKRERRKKWGRRTRPHVPPPPLALLVIGIVRPNILRSSPYVHRKIIFSRSSYDALELVPPGAFVRPVHLFTHVTSCLLSCPLDVKGWLQLVIVTLSGLCYKLFFKYSIWLAVLVCTVLVRLSPCAN